VAIFDWETMAIGLVAIEEFATSQFTPYL
jgi:hypothetical protein